MPLCCVINLLFDSVFTQLDVGESLEFVFFEYFTNHTSFFFFFLFLKTVPLLQRLTACFILLCRYQPGSAALSGYQGNWGRIWRCVCPQHQPRLLTTSLRVCQRTGTVPATQLPSSARGFMATSQFLAIV